MAIHLEARERRGRGQRDAPFGNDRSLRSPGRLESTLSGHTGPRPWTPQLGGERAYKGRLGKGRSLGHSRHSP